MARLPLYSFGPHADRFAAKVRAGQIATDDDVLAWMQRHERTTNALLCAGRWDDAVRKANQTPRKETT